jgi:hypothetical protein
MGIYWTESESAPSALETSPLPTASFAWEGGDGGAAGGECSASVCVCEREIERRGVGVRDRECGTSSTSEPGVCVCVCV